MDKRVHLAAWVRSGAAGTQRGGGCWSEAAAALSQRRSSWESRAENPLFWAFLLCLFLLSHVVSQQHVIYKSLPSARPWPLIIMAYPECFLQISPVSREKSLRGEGRNAATSWGCRCTWGPAGPRRPGPGAPCVGLMSVVKILFCYDVNAVRNIYIDTEK